MSVEDRDKVDIVTECADGAVTLIITDHLHWGDPEHLFALQEKLNTYLAFIETGQIADHAPEAGKTGIKVVMKHEPDQAGREFLMKAGEVTGRAGFALTYEVQGDA